MKKTITIASLMAALSMSACLIFTILDAQHICSNAAILNGFTVKNGAAIVLGEAGGTNGGGASARKNISLKNTIADNHFLNCNKSISIKEEVCQGEPIVLTAIEVGTYFWSTGDTTASITTSELYEDAMYTVTVIIDEFCTICDTFKITVYGANDIPTITSISADTLCQSDFVTLRATSSDGSGIEWFSTASGNASFLGSSVSGEEFTTKLTINSTSTYWAQVNNGICAPFLPRTDSIMAIVLPEHAIGI
jgi:hypothetical protein